MTFCNASHCNVTHHNPTEDTAFHWKLLCEVCIKPNDSSQYWHGSAAVIGRMWLNLWLALPLSSHRNIIENTLWYVGEVHKWACGILCYGKSMQRFLASVKMHAELALHVDGKRPLLCWNSSQTDHSDTVVPNKHLVFWSCSFQLLAPSETTFSLNWITRTLADCC